MDKNGLIAKLNAYAATPDDDNIFFKEKIKDKLLKCPELLYALNNKDYESELFDSDGNVNALYNEDGEVVEVYGDWGLYFNDNIKPYLFVPEVQVKSKNFVCYRVGFREIPRYNSTEKICQIMFIILCDSRETNAIDSNTGIARHDLISSIIREHFNWSNIFNLQCSLVHNEESLTDNNYITRKLIFEVTLPNSIVQTKDGKTSVINHMVRK